MDFDFLRLKPIRPFRLGDNLLKSSLTRLQSITKNLPPAGAIPTSRLAEVRRKVRAGFLSKLPFENYTDFSRRETILLHLYYNDLHREEDRKSLPLFDESVAISLLDGKNSKVRREQATRLFLTHFGEERVPCLSWLASWLRVSWKKEYLEKQTEEISPYITEAETLFNVDAPQKVAEKRLKNESIENLLLRFKIPDSGEFKERLFEELVLQRLKSVPHLGIDDELQRIVTESKTKILRNGYALGSEAVKILINRSINESEGIFPAGWQKQIIQFASDPRFGNKTEQARWWGWATEKQKTIARNALNKLTLEEFIGLLKDSLINTEYENQFKEREGFLLRLLRLGKIIEAKLVVNMDIYKSLDSKTISFLQPSQSIGTTGSRIKTSFVCLKCENDVFLIEGTHSFALRAFIGVSRFPIRSFWDSPPKAYNEAKFRIEKSSCDIWQQHLGSWISIFLEKLRRHKVEWRVLNSQYYR